MSKQHLQMLVQKLKLQHLTLRYKTTPAMEAGRKGFRRKGFKACVTVNGICYPSNEICARKKWAEAAAAEIALLHLCQEKGLAKIVYVLIKSIMARRKLGMPKFGVSKAFSSSSSAVVGFQASIIVGETTYWGSIATSKRLAKTNAAIKAFNALCTEFNSVELLWPLKLERSVGPYSNKHDILLVGEGDFSFSLSLAMAFGSAHRMICTSLDSRELLLCFYSSSCVQILLALEDFGAKIFHNVDATKMKDHSHLKQMRFDRIVFNFPHLGFSKIRHECDPEHIRRHKNFVKMFLRNAVALIKKPFGEIHITHKTGHPYDQWHITKQAQKCGLVLKNADLFYEKDYPGYINRKSYLPYPHETFNCHGSRTFRFTTATVAEHSDLQQREQSKCEDILNFTGVHAECNVFSVFCCKVTKCIGYMVFGCFALMFGYFALMMYDMVFGLAVLP